MKQKFSLAQLLKTLLIVLTLWGVLPSERAMAQVNLTYHQWIMELSPLVHNIFSILGSAKMDPKDVLLVAEQIQSDVRRGLASHVPASPDDTCMSANIVSEIFIQDESSFYMYNLEYIESKLVEWRLARNKRIKQAREKLETQNLHERLKENGTFEARALLRGNKDSYPQKGKVLFLGAGKSTIPEKLSSQNPGLQVFKTDISYPVEPEVRENLVIQKLNHGAPFHSFKDNSMAVITMELGLCSCGSKYQSCGGITFCPYESQQSPEDNFFQEVVRVLDKGNPNSIAVLHGSNRDTPPQAKSYYRKLLEKLGELHSLSIRYIANGDDMGNEYMIVIKPAR